MGYRLDPTGYLARLSHAEDDRRVGLRAAPDVMGYLTALLTLPQAAACYTALTRHADSLIAGGDGRSRGQIMADTLVARLTGQETAANVPVEINLIMTDQALFGPDVVAAARAAAAADPGDPAAGEPSGAASHQPDDVDGVDGADDLDGDDAGGGDAEVADTDGEEPAYLLGYGYLPAPYAGQLILGASTRTPRWLRRLFRDPRTGQLAAMESRRRCFTPAQRRFVQLRGEVCRTPWCGAAEDGTVTITTPTGHQYQHRAPDPPGDPPSPESAAA